MKIARPRYNNFPLQSMVIIALFTGTLILVGVTSALLAIVGIGAVLA